MRVPSGWLPRVRGRLAAYQIRWGGAPDRKLWPARRHLQLTGIATIVGTMAKKPIKPIERYLLSSAEARNPDFIVKLFERLKGRPANAQEIADLEREITAVKDTKP